MKTDAKKPVLSWIRAILLALCFVFAVRNLLKGIFASVTHVTFGSNEVYHYRLGDIIFHVAGGCCREHKRLANQILQNHPRSLVSRYLAHATEPKNFTALELAINEVCPPVYQGPEILIHLRLGDVVCGQSWHEKMKRPFSVTELQDALRSFRNRTIGLCFNINEASISGNCDAESERYLGDLAQSFPHAIHYAPGAFADIHFCAMASAPLFVAGKGYFSQSIVKARDRLGRTSINLAEGLPL